MISETTACLATSKQTVGNTMYKIIISYHILLYHVILTASIYYHVLFCLLSLVPGGLPYEKVVDAHQEI